VKLQVGDMCLGGLLTRRLWVRFPRDPPFSVCFRIIASPSPSTGPRVHHATLASFRWVNLESKCPHRVGSGHFHRTQDGKIMVFADGHTLEVEESFERFVRLHAKPLLAYCLRRTPPADAHEAAAEVFATAWRKYDDIPQGDAALYWLFGVARRVLSNQRRGMRRRQGLMRRVASDVGDTLPSPEASAVANEQYQEVMTALRRLRSRDREILTLIVWDEVPRSEVAQFLGISSEAVHKRYQRALRRLEDHLDSAARGSHAGHRVIEEGRSA
jgi:RNA polymerase sigma factor (sigma-70 family)